MTSDKIQNCVSDVQNHIAALEQKYQRQAGSVQLLVVSKTQPITALETAMTAGLSSFGESYIQDALPKIHYFSEHNAELTLDWHFIGPIQSNKSSKIAQHFSWVHSLDRIIIAQRLNQQRPDHLAPLNICIQVNIDELAQKSGINASECRNFALQLEQYPRLKLRGLMTVPEPYADLEQQRIAFKKLHDLYQQLNLEGFNLDTLSMGMSNDLEAAIAEGATIVRIGSAIFGIRNK